MKLKPLVPILFFVFLLAVVEPAASMGGREERGQADEQAAEQPAEEAGEAGEPDEAEGAPGTGEAARAGAGGQEDGAGQEPQAGQTAGGQNGGRQTGTTGDSASSAQTAAAAYPTRLRVAIKDPQVRLTWNDSEALAGESYEIYRHEREITEETFPEAELVGTVAEGTESFLDVPEENGEYFYTVVARDADGRTYRSFAALRNTTDEPVRITQSGSVEQPFAQVTGLTATAREDSVRLRFESSRRARTLAVYRSTQRLSTLEQLTSATRIQTISGRQGRFTDHPVPGVPYYYAVVDTEAVSQGEVTLRPGQNVTEETVRIALDGETPGVSRREPSSEEPSPEEPVEDVAVPETAPRERPGREAPEPERTGRETPPGEIPPQEVPSPGAREPSRVRPTPLPLLQLSRELGTGRPLPTPQTRVPERRAEIDESTRAAITSLRNRMELTKPTTARVTPTVLPPDRESDSKGAAFTLRTILTGPFQSEQWDEALRLLGNLLSLPLSDELESRVHFYRGQAYFFTGDYREAFFAFLLARDDYYARATPWIDVILREMSAS